ncbi:hypothetical protein [Methylocapsa sp. S129]|uniref:hypothetical protein n=1 Tax=Methylocapsa sp. S129 TaxID=1641869 RepID=UPI00131B017D|nr:hypothetical protein [Methylocapsa sp. S129]
MSSAWNINRRRLLGLIGGAAASSAVPAAGASKKPRDRGIGGTGFAPGPAEEQDRGIGGTGFVGAIQRFGSIIVNDSRIGYRQDVNVDIDGAARTARDLRIGQIVRAVAHSREGALSTHRIAIVSEVVGRIDNLSDETMDVLGQSIILAGLEPAPWRRKGARVAVSGLRRIDGAIVASAVELRGDGLDQVVGEIENDGGSSFIGDLKLVDLDAGLIGKRAALVGHRAKDGFRVIGGRADDAPFGGRIDRLSLESFVRRVGADLRLGSGLLIHDSPAASQIPENEEARAFVDAVVDSDGQTRIEAIRFAGGPAGASGPAGPAPGAPGPGPGPGSGPGGAGPGSGSPGGPGSGAAGGGHGPGMGH